MPILISTFIDDTFQHRRFRAPRNSMYEISSILFSVNIAGTNFLLVVDRELAPDIQTSSLLETIGQIDTGVIGNFQILDMDTRTKTLTLIKAGSTSITVRVVVYGKVISASKRELIIEWFRKR